MKDSIAKASLILMSTVLFASGCGMTNEYHDPAFPDRENDDIGELASRPSLEQVKSNYDAMVSELKDEIAAIVPGTKWEQGAKGYDRKCGNPLGSQEITPYSHSPEHAISRNRVPEDKVDQTLETFKRIAAKYGFDKYLDVYQLTNGIDARVYGEFEGDSIKLSWESNIVIAGGLDCYIKAADKNLLEPGAGN